MFGSSAALKAVQLENAQLRLELEKLTKLVEAVQAEVLSELELNALIDEAINEKINDIDIAAEVETAVENCLDRANISIRF